MKTTSLFCLSSFILLSFPPSFLVFPISLHLFLSFAFFLRPFLYFPLFILFHYSYILLHLLIYLTKVYQLITLMMEAANTPETLLNFYQTTRRNNPEDSHLHQLHTFYSDRETVNGKWVRRERKRWSPILRNCSNISLEELRKTMRNLGHESLALYR
jgi:hypothetical protein